MPLFHEIPGVMRAAVEVFDVPVRVGDRFVPQQFWVKLHSDGDKPAVTMKIEVRQGVPVCTELQITAQPDGPEIRPKDLKNIQVDSIVERAVALVSHQQDASGLLTKSAPTQADQRNAQRARRGEVRQPGPGRPRVAADRLRQAADLYLRHVDGGRPLQVIAEVLDVTDRTAARYVEQSRREGLLPSREGK